MSAFRLSHRAVLLLVCAVSLFALCLAVPNKTEQNVCTKPAGNCTCSPYGEFEEIRVDCHHLNFTSVPINAHLPPKTSYLDLRMNNILKLAKLEKNDDIKHLSLSTNDLQMVDNYAFDDVKNLVYLDLSHNHLTKLPDTLFDVLNTLQYLNLSYNKLEFLPKDIFKKCDRLFELRLGHNPLKQINAETFLYLQQVEILDLSQNEIFSLESGTFHTMTKLDTLDLSGNEFDAVPVNALRNTRRLESLDLSYNPIKTVNEASFYKLYTLKELTMNHMKSLVEIKKKAFSSLFNLERLSIQHNVHLSYIDPYAFLGIFNQSYIRIKHVSLRRNSISTLAEGTLPFCNLTDLDLSDNPWRCDCHLHWIKYCEEKIASKHQKGIMCVNPEKLRGQELETLSHKSLVCENPNSMQQSSVLFTASLFCMFAMFAIMVLFIYRDRLAVYGNNRKQGSIYYVRAQSENDQ